MQGLDLAADEVRQVVRRDGSIYPADNEDVRERFVDLALKLDIITLAVDQEGRLQGFLTCYRSWDGAPLDLSRPEVQVGNSVTVDNVWIRPDRRGTKALKDLIRLALVKNRERNAGAEKLFVHMRRAAAGKDVFRGFDYPAFWRKYGA